MRFIPTKRWVIWAALISAGWYDVLRPFGVPATLFFCGASLVYIDRQKMTRPLPPKELKWSILVAAAIMLMMISSALLFPHSHFSKLAHFSRSPWLVVPLWLASLLIGYYYGCLQNRYRVANS